MGGCVLWISIGEIGGLRFIKLTWGVDEKAKLVKYGGKLREIQRPRIVNKEEQILRKEKGVLTINCYGGL